MALNYSNKLAKAARVAELKAKLSPAVSLRTVLYLYLRTPRHKYIEEAVYLDRLISWLEPISIPTPTMQLAQVHNISSSHLQRFIARRLSCPYETIHWCIKYEVWPMLERSGVIYEY